VLKHANIERGDRVALYMPLVPELAIAMLACARIGAQAVLTCCHTGVNREL
jgi:acetyl-CoA synthetase